MTHKTKWLLALILVLTLAGMGVAYGYWTQTLSIGGTATTGTMSVRVVPYGNFIVATDNETTQNVGTCSVTTPDSDHWQLTIDNAYPGYTCDAWLIVHNNGTLPVKSPLPVVTNNDPDYVDFQYNFDNLAANGVDCGHYKSITGENELWTKDTVLMPTASEKDEMLYCNFRVVVKSEVTEEDATYTLTGSFTPVEFSDPFTTLVATGVGTPPQPVE